MKELKPFYYALFDDADGFIVTLNLQFHFTRDTILPPYTARLVKYAVYTSDCLEPIRLLYESRGAHRPVTITPLYTLSGRPLYQKADNDKPLVASRGVTLNARIAAVAGNPVEIVESYTCGGRLPQPYDSVEFEVIEASVEKAESLSTGLTRPEIIKVEFKTPLVMSTKTMVPPSLQRKKIIERTPNVYRLLPTPGYLAATLARTWIGALLGRDPDTHPEPYALGRIADILVAEQAYNLKPTTILYGKTSEGEEKKIRGVTGWITYKIHSKRLALTLDKLLALAERIGTGKNRSIGLGQIQVKPQTIK